MDLCSGDSYISQKFFFDCSNIIVSVDLDGVALERGKKRLTREKFLNRNHYFLQCDIEKETINNLLKKKNLEKKFNLVLFNAAIEHFKFGQIKFILNSLKEVMSNDSLIFAYTLVEDKKKPNYLLEHHECSLMISLNWRESLKIF